MEGDVEDVSRVGGEESEESDSSGDMYDNDKLKSPHVICLTSALMQVH